MLRLGRFAHGYNERIRAKHMSALFFSKSSRQQTTHATVPNYVYAIVGGTTVLVGIGYVSYLDTVPVTGRRRWVAVSPDFETKLGHQEYQNLLKQCRKDILPPDHPASITLNRVGKRIAESSLSFAEKYNVKPYLGIYRSSPFTFTVVRSDMANAFVLPGNHVFLFTGLFQFVHNEDDLAAVVGHEVAHNVARHAAEKLSGSAVTNLLAIMTLFVDPSGVLLKVVLPATAIFRSLPNSRTQEIEADRIGMRISTDACYDPNAAKRIFVSMKEHESSGSGGLEFLSTHPSHDTRIEKFDTWAREATESMDQPEKCREIRTQMEAARRAAALKRIQRLKR